MGRLELTVPVNRPHDEAARAFAGDVSAWLPVIVGPDERSWRAQTDEGPVHVRVQVEAGYVFVHPDATRWRRFSVAPDRTSNRNLFTAMLTPAVEGQLGLAPRPDGGSTLRFEGRTSRRNGLTGALERRLLGDHLARSGVETLLEEVSQRLETVGSTEPPRGSAGTVVCKLPPR